jgi:hypothetical protein
MGEERERAIREAWLRVRGCGAYGRLGVWA